MFIISILIRNCSATNIKHEIELKKVCIVSLGSNCRVATWLRELKLSTHSYPFDWVESEEIDCLTNLFENNFRNYLLFENLIPYNNHHFNRVRDTRYKINLVHDFSFQKIFEFNFNTDENLKKGLELIEKEYSSIYNKYLRRIARFTNLGNTYEKIIFVRTQNVTQHAAIQLFSSLKKLIPENKIILTIINDIDEYEDRWQFNNIKNFYLPTTHLTTDNYSDSFLKILDEILNELSI